MMRVFVRLTVGVCILLSCFQARAAFSDQSRETWGDACLNGVKRLGAKISEESESGDGRWAQRTHTIWLSFRSPERIIGLTEYCSGGCVESYAAFLTAEGTTAPISAEEQAVLLSCRKISLWTAGEASDQFSGLPILEPLGCKTDQPALEPSISAAPPAVLVVPLAGVPPPQRDSYRLLNRAPDESLGGSGFVAQCPCLEIFQGARFKKSAADDIPAPWEIWSDNARNVSTIPGLRAPAGMQLIGRHFGGVWIIGSHGNEWWLRSENPESLGDQRLLRVDITRGQLQWFQLHQARMPVTPGAGLKVTDGGLEGPQWKIPWAVIERAEGAHCEPMPFSG